MTYLGPSQISAIHGQPMAKPPKKKDRKAVNPELFVGDNFRFWCILIHFWGRSMDMIQQLKQIEVVRLLTGSRFFIGGVPLPVAAARWCRSAWDPAWLWDWALQTEFAIDHPISSNFIQVHPFFDPFSSIFINSCTCSSMLIHFPD